MELGNSFALRERFRAVRRRANEIEGELIGACNIDGCNIDSVRAALLSSDRILHVFVEYYSPL